MTHLSLKIKCLQILVKRSCIGKPKFPKTNSHNRSGGLMNKFKLNFIVALTPIRHEPYGKKLKMCDELMRLENRNTMRLIRTADMFRSHRITVDDKKKFQYFDPA